MSEEKQGAWVGENADAAVWYSPKSGLLVELDDSPGLEAPVPLKSNPESDTKIAYWGSSNTFPQTIEAELAKNSDIGSALDWQARALYAGGLKYKVKEIKADGTFEVKEKYLPEVDRFVRMSKLSYFLPAAKDFYKFVNVFPRLHMNGDKSKIVRLVAENAAYCRFGKQNEKTGAIDNVYVNANWGTGGTSGDPLTLTYPVIDPLTADIKKLKESKARKFNYIYPVSYPTGKTYYQLADWASIINSKWLELANKIPAFKLALMKNQLTIKYHIKIPGYWWEWKYPTWNKMKPEEQKAKQEETFGYFNDFLKGEEKAGKTISSTFQVEKGTLKPYPGIEIVPIDDKIKDGIYLEDSVEATIKIFSALGLDPALYGIIPGKGGSNRSGSDKREALNIYMSLIQPHVDVLVQPYDFVADYNGWNTETQQIMFYTEKPYLQTLNEVTPGKRETKIEEVGE